MIQTRLFARQLLIDLTTVCVHSLHFVIINECFVERYSLLGILAGERYIGWGEFQDRITVTWQLMVEDGQIKLIPFHCQVIGRHPRGNQTAEIRPLPGNKIIQSLKADKFILIGVRFTGIRFREIAACVPKPIKKFSVIEN